MTPRWGLLIQTLGFLIFLSCIKRSYQQKEVRQLSQELSFCAKSSTETTLQTFWRESSGHCALDVGKLMQLYGSIDVQKGDKCSQLLSHHIRKQLIETSSHIYAEALISDSFRDSAVINQLSEQLSLLDGRVTEAVWERAIDEVYLFMNKTELADLIYQGTITESNVAALLYLYQKYVSRGDYDSRLPVIIVHYLNKISKNGGNLSQGLQKRVKKMFNNLPSQLRLLYIHDLLGLLNVAHWEYLYAPHDEALDSVRQKALTWIANKNSTNTDGDLRVELRGNADIAIGGVYDEDQVKYLFVDEDLKRAFFWIGTGTQPNRWWRTEWHDGYLTFTNVRANQLLCATTQYDANRRYVTLRPPGGGLSSSECHWMVTTQINGSKD